MGRVYRARDRQTNLLVAVKVLSAQGVLEAARFAREIEVLAGLSHPAIVRFLSQGYTEEGEPFLVTEWLEGEDLGVRLRRAGLTIAESLALGARIGSGLGEAHRHGIVHRDIKPGNLWLVDGRPGDVKILDFGIARSECQERTLTQAGAMIGTPGYMAPEQARGERRIDARADVFSIGCVLFKCLTGRLPFDGDDVMAVLLKLVLDDAPRLREICPDAPLALEDLIGRMLSKTPAERPADGAAVAAEIARIEHHGDGPAAPPSASASALTTSERPVMCVVLARVSVVPEGMLDSEPTVAMPDGARRALVTALGPHGGELAVLADGSLVVTVPSAGAFTDQAARAARSALAVRQGYPGAAITVVAGRGERASRLPMGDVIDRGVELLRRTAAGAIRVDEGIAGLIAAAFDLRGDEAGLLLCRERAAEGKRTLLGKATPFVGRDRELSALEAIFDEVALDQVARAVLITAPPGVGKSRLRLELVRLLRERAPVVGGEAESFVLGASAPPRGGEAGFELWLGRGDPMRAGSPFGLLAPMIRGLAGVLDGEPIEARRRKLGARVGRNLDGAERARVTLFLGELAGVPFPDEDSVELAAARRDALLMGDQLRRAFEDFLAAELATGPVLLALDDAHWGDRPSLQLVDLALRNLHERPLMVLAMARPEISDLFPGLWVGRPVTQLKLAALTRKASERLVRQVLGPSAEAEVVARIVDLAGGDAFYLEELIRAVAERTGDHLPETVLAMVQQRLDGLDVNKRRVLRAASVFGGVFWASGVHALLGGDERTPSVTEALADLADRELIHRRPLAKFPGQEEYVFRQTLVREAAYAMLTDTDRRLGHRLAAEWLERAGESDPVAVAEHFDRAGEPGRALAAYHRAAAQALESNDFDQALAWAERAIRGVPDAGRSPARAEIGAVHLLRAEALRWRDELARAEPSAALAMELLPRGSAQWFIAAGEVAILGGRLGHDDRLAAVADELAALWGPEPETAHIVAAARAAAFLVLRGDYGRADVLLARVEAIEPRILEPAARARIDQAVSSRALVRGDLGVHLSRMAAAIAHFGEAGDQRNATLSRITLGFAHASVARYDAAARELREALATAERMVLPAVAAYAKHTLGHVMAQLGAFDEAIALESEAVESFAAHGDARLSGGSRVYLGLIRAQRGELAAAEKEMDRALDELAHVPPVRAYALAARARVRLARARPAEALTDAEAAFTVLRELGGIEEGEALVRLVYVEALLAAGRRDAAAEVCAEARRRLLERAERISDASMRERFLHVVAENARTLALAAEIGAPA